MPSSSSSSKSISVHTLLSSSSFSSLTRIPSHPTLVLLPISTITATIFNVQLLKYTGTNEAEMAFRVHVDSEAIGNTQTAHESAVPSHLRSNSATSETDSDSSTGSSTPPVPSSCIIRTTLTSSTSLADSLAHLHTQLTNSPIAPLLAPTTNINEYVTYTFTQLSEEEAAGQPLRTNSTSTLTMSVCLPSYYNHHSNENNNNNNTNSHSDIRVSFSYDILSIIGQADYRSRCLSHFQTLLSFFSTASIFSTSTSLSSLSLLSSEEQQLLLLHYSGAQSYLSLSSTSLLLHELFEATVDQYGKNIALLEEGKEMSYEEVEKRSNQLANWLRGQGVVRGSYVGMFLPRSMSVYISLLAILKAGAAYVPIDPEYPADRVSYILSDCQAKVVITQSELLKDDLILPDFTRALCVDTEQTSNELTRCSSHRLSRTETGTTHTDVAYVIYTSGSTGRPKGVMIEHRSVVNLVRAEKLIFGVHSNDRVYQGFSIAFDASVEEVWLAFHSGATLFVATYAIVHSGPALGQILIDNHITVLSCVPTLLSMFDTDVPEIRILILGGEAMPKDLVARWMGGEKKGKRRMINSYGPTEATVIGTYAECNLSAPIVTIGKPVPTYFCYILDPDLNPVPIGSTGELHIGGVCVARGYVNRPDLTAEKFIPFPTSTLSLPNSSSPSSSLSISPSTLSTLLPSATPRLYKTGDLARWTEEGEIEFCGRIDAQVKLRGFRVELSEIESVMMQCKGIQTAVVNVFNVGGIQQLVGYVILKNGIVEGNGEDEFEDGKLRDEMRIKLAPYMIPSVIQVVTSFPTLPSGKVNRSKLQPPTPKLIDNNQSSVDDSSLTPMEKKLATVWRDLFQRSTISPSDDFFSLGGHSLLAAQLVTLLRKDQETQTVTMTDIYSCTTLEKLAEKLTRVNGGGGGEKDKGMGLLNGVGGQHLYSSHETPVGGWDAEARIREKQFMRVSDIQYVVTGFFQAIALYFVYAIPAASIGVPWELFLLLRHAIIHSQPYAHIIAWICVVVLLAFPLFVLLTILLKWVLIGRYREGRWPLFGFYYFRWWLIQRLQYLLPLVYLRGSPMLSWYCAAMGAKMGRNVFLNTHHLEAYDLIEIGEDTSIGVDAQILNFHVEQGWLTVKKIVIGKRCYIGARAVVSGGCRMEDDAQLAVMSLLPHGTIVGEDELWRGSPAQPVNKPQQRGTNQNGVANGIPHPLSATVSADLSSLQDDIRIQFADPNPEVMEDDSILNRTASSLLSDSLIDGNGMDKSSSLLRPYQRRLMTRPTSWQIARLAIGQSLCLSIMPFLILIATAPGLVMIHFLMPVGSFLPSVRQNSWIYLAAAPPTAVCFVVLICLQITALKWMLLGHTKPGNYSIHSYFYLKKWTIDMLMSLSLATIHNLYATLYLPPWFKSLGAKLGKDVEISTAAYITPDLLTVGDGSFVADSVYCGIPAVYNNIIRLAGTTIGSRTFLGNGCTLSTSTSVGDNCLIGVLSTAPMAADGGMAPIGAPYNWPEPEAAVANNTSWLGSPALFLPQRQKAQGTFTLKSTFEPTAWLKCQRLFVEFWRITLPLMIMTASMLLLIGDINLLRHRLHSELNFWLLFPVLYMAGGIASCIVVWMLKWIIVGKYKQCENPLWSNFVWRTEFVTGLMEALAHPYFINQLRGTPFVCWWFRAMGSSIGSRVFMDTCQISEPDLVNIGDDASLSLDAIIQTHLFEDRIMKMDHLYIGERASVGHMSVILYGSRMKEGAVLHPLSLLMKGEELPPWSSWEGVPSQRVQSEYLKAYGRKSIIPIDQEDSCFC